MVSFRLFCVIFFSLQLNIADRGQQTLSALLSTAKSNNGIIEGNPLLYSECRNALLDTHHSNLAYLNLSGLATPWFWSRESLDAVIKNQPLGRRVKYTHNGDTTQQSIPWSEVATLEYGVARKLIPSHVLKWYTQLGRQIHADATLPLYAVHDDNGDMQSDAEHAGNTCFYHIEKSGSSSLSGMMHEFDMNTSYTGENAALHCQCGFTFLRDPISRFVSGYYTINKLIYWYYEHLPRLGKPGPDFSGAPKRFSFYNVTGEPQRMIEFIRNLWDYAYEFTKVTPLEHMMTQAGILSVAQFDVHFIGDVSQMMQHLDVIRTRCGVETGNRLLQDKELIEKQIMTHFGTKWMDELRPWYTDMLSLDDYVAGDLDPAYLVIADNYDLYAKIVEYYRQDYVCFGFEHDWRKFRAKVYEKWQTTKMRKQRTKTNDTKHLIVDP